MSEVKAYHKPVKPAQTRTIQGLEQPDFVTPIESLYQSRAVSFEAAIELYNELVTPMRRAANVYNRAVAKGYNRLEEIKETGKL